MTDNSLTDLYDYDQEVDLLDDNNDDMDTVEEEEEENDN